MYQVINIGGNGYHEPTEYALDVTYFDGLDDFLLRVDDQGKWSFVKSWKDLKEEAFVTGMDGLPGFVGFYFECLDGGRKIGRGLEKRVNKYFKRQFYLNGQRKLVSKHYRMLASQIGISDYNRRGFVDND